MTRSVAVPLLILMILLLVLLVKTSDNFSEKFACELALLDSLHQDDLIPPGAENDDSENEVNELPNLDHQDNPSIPHLYSEHRDVEKNNVLNPQRD
ncbi:hypothetical protein Tco_0331341 [Tanacetum coccineum]